MSTPHTPLTLELVSGWTGTELKKYISTPEGLNEVNALLNARIAPEIAAPVVVPDAEVAPQPTQEELDAAAAAKAETDRVAAEAVAKAADRAAEERAAELKSAGIAVEYDQAGGIVKIVKNYQAKDDSGNPIGRPTHLEAKTWVELSVKQQNAHENAVRFAERLKKQKPTFKKEEVAQPTLSDEELLKIQEDLKGEDRDKAAQAAAKLREDDSIKLVEKANKAIKVAEEAKIALDWMRLHINDYNPCQANSDILQGYMTDNNLDFTGENLEIAFTAVESQLAPKEVPVVSVTVAPVVNPPVEPPVPPVVAEVPAAPVVPANPAPPARRPGVNAGLVPGQNAGVRPAPGPVGLTKKEIKGWTGEQMRKEMKSSPARRAEIEKVLSGK